MIFVLLEMRIGLFTCNLEILIYIYKLSSDNAEEKTKFYTHTQTPFDLS